ncbi:MAG TPA: VWA domain-containing protein [Bryobacteraceae bacterium]|jgi:Mg-chelatase subunit ChlD|nr:VWA domain-containing protein [Bryobacteraceae bacterium]
MRFALPLVFLAPVLAFAAGQSPAQSAPAQTASAQNAPSDTPTVFKSDVAMTRVDAQVLDSSGRAITGMQLEDFVLRLNGRLVPIRNFASDNMPLDVLLLLDVSGSMEPHVERIANAAQEALNVLTPKDRVAIMVFDTYARVRLPFRSSHSEVTSALHRLLRSEGFNGGTFITRAMIQAASYVQKNARPEARRAIVILTDDETQDSEDEPRVEAALDRANAMLSFLRAPYELPGSPGGGGVPHGTWGTPGSNWPGTGGGWPGGGGPVILGRPGGYGADPSHTAGTDTIARDSGGDVMSVDDASSLENTLARLRQRYALYFYVPDGMTASPGSVEVGLSQEARIRFHDADIHYRRVYMAGGKGGSEQAGPTLVRRANPNYSSEPEPQLPVSESAPSSSSKGRRVMVNEDSGSPVNTIDTDSGQPALSTPSNSPSQGQTSQSQSGPAQPSKSQTAPTGGWPRASQTSSPQQFR